MKIAAVVVTYNRINLLQKTIRALKEQETPVNRIIVINNGSTDGTEKWLEEQSDITVINQDNVGGSGGFYSGIKYAFENGFDWIWCMDDDVYPQKDCLKKLLSYDSENIGILCPMRVQNMKPYLSEVKKLNLTNPFRKLHKEKITNRDIEKSKTNEIVGMTFEGPLIKRNVVEKIKFPNKEYFLFYDDTDYSYRAYLAGFKILHISDANLIKESFFDNVSDIEKVRRNKWKLQYHLRNTTYFIKTYGKTALFRNIGSFPLYIRMFFAITKNLLFNKKYSVQDYCMLGKMFCAGINKKLGKIQ